MQKVVIPASPGDPVSIKQSFSLSSESGPRLELRIGYEGRGQGRHARLTILQAKQIGYALLLEAEKLDDQ